MCVWVSLAILLICRSEVLIALHTSAVGAIVLGSIHVWVLLLLFLAAVSGAPESRTWVGTLSEGRTRDAGLSDETVAVAPRSS